MARSARRCSSRAAARRGRLLVAGGGSLTTVLSLNFIDNTALPTCAAEAVRDATQPIDSCIVNNRFDACTSEDDCFIRAP